MPSWRTFLCSTLIVMVVGCGGGGPQIVPIEGTVTHNGQPVPNIRIYFVPTDGRPSWAISDANGHFKLDYDIDHDGAKVGTHSVWILDESGNIDETAAMSGGPRPKRNPAIRELADKYSREKSTLTVEVTKADRNYQLKLE